MSRAGRVNGFFLDVFAHFWADAAASAPPTEAPTMRREVILTGPSFPALVRELVQAGLDPGSARRRATALLADPRDGRPVDCGRGVIATTWQTGRGGRRFQIV